MTHAFREQETPNADPSRLTQNTHIGPQSVAEGMAVFNAALPAKYRKDAVLAIEYLISATPEDLVGRSREQQDQYFHDALEWLRRKHGSEQVIYAGIHRDESSPHMYAYVVPVDRETGRLNAKKWLGAADALTRMQTDFAEQVGKRHGLKRGIEGSKAHHTTVKEFYAAIQNDVHNHDRVSAEQLEPVVLKKRFIGTIVETPEEVAERLTNAVRDHYDPVLKQASVALLERRRSTEMASTAHSLGLALKRAEERLRAFESTFLDGLSESDRQQLADFAAQLRRNREVEVEKSRRVDALPELLPRVAGAAVTFVEKALTAIQAQAGDWTAVHWEKVEQEAIREAVHHHHQPVRQAIEAILRYSPRQADKGPEEISRLLDEVELDDRHPRQEGPMRDIDYSPR